MQIGIDSFAAAYDDVSLAVDTSVRLRNLVEQIEHAAHYVSDLKEFSGIVFPTKRRIFPRQPDGRSVPEPLVVSIDLDHFVLS